MLPACFPAGYHNPDKDEVLAKEETYAFKDKYTMIVVIVYPFYFYKPKQIYDFVLLNFQVVFPSKGSNRCTSSSVAYITSDTVTLTILPPTSYGLYHPPGEDSAHRPIDTGRILDNYASNNPNTSPHFIPGHIGHFFTAHRTT